MLESEYAILKGCKQINIDRQSNQPLENSKSCKQINKIERVQTTNIGSKEQTYTTTICL